MELSDPVQAQGDGLGWRRAALIAAVALSWRLAYLGVACMASEFFAPFLDARWHVQWAEAVSRGHLLGSEAFFRAPLYPYALGALFALVGPDLLVARVVQILLGSLAAVMVGLLGARLFGRRTGLLAGLLYASAASLVVFDLELLVEALFVPLAVLALLAFERAERAPSAVAVFGLGAALGLAAITRPNILAFVPVAAAGIGLAAWRVGQRGARLLRTAALLALGLGLPIAPVTLHNWVASHEFDLIASQGGVNFYIGNSADASGDESFMPGPTDTATYAANGTYTDNVLSAGRFVAEQSAHRTLKPSEISGYWFGRAWAWIRVHPADWLRLTARKLFYLCGAFEIGDQRNLTATFDAWWPFRFFPRWGWLAPLALAGALWPGERRGRMMLGSFLAVYAATVVAFFVTERFRLPLYPAVCILAARFLVAAWNGVRHAQHGQVLLHAALAAAVGVAIAGDPTGYTLGERAEAAAVRAQIAARVGDVRAAEHAYLGALSLLGEAASARRSNLGGRVDLNALDQQVRRGYAALLVAQGRTAEAAIVAPGGAPPPTPGPEAGEQPNWPRGKNGK